MLHGLGTLLVVAAWITVVLNGCSRRAPAGSTSSELRSKMAEGTTLYAKGKYSAAEQIFQQAYVRALQSGDTYTALRALNSVGGARFAAFRYKEAMRTFLETRRLARQAGDSEMIAAVSSNLSSLYLQQQDTNAGARAAEDTLAALEDAGTTKWGPLLRTQAAIVYSRQGRFDLALPLLRGASAEADAQGDVRTASLIWDQIGHELMLRGRLEEAEGALFEAYRQRKLFKIGELAVSYYTIGRLRLAQGDAVQADQLLSKSIAGLAQGGGILPLWRVYYERGRARTQAHRFADALDDFQRAREAAHRIRLEALPADSIWISTGVEQSSLWSELIQVASILFFQTGDPAHARLAFEVSEENRAASLRALVHSPEVRRERLPSEYWELLARLRRNEAALLQSPDESTRRESSYLQYRMTEMEAEAGLSLDLSPGFGATGFGNLVKRVRGSLQDDEVLFSFHLNEPDSALWAVKRNHFQMVRLPSRTRIRYLAKRFRDDIEADRVEAAASGEQLFRELFGSLPPRILMTPRWLLELDDDLFQVPFAALVSGHSEGRPRYLAETHSSVIVPSALLLKNSHAADWRGDFVAIGDPIYNAADPRKRNRSARTASFFTHILPPMFAGTDGGTNLELPRLVGSAREIEACAHAMPADVRPLLLEGAHATVQKLDESLKSRPAILHFATHFLQSAGEQTQALMALSLDRYGSPELLGPMEISRRTVDLDLVVLSGCASGRGEALPAEGLMGMTRAWLAAGSRSVLATLWPALDDQGELLVAFYTHLYRLRTARANWAAADALRMAQMDMLSSTDVHAAPRRWGAFVVAVRE